MTPLAWGAICERPEAVAALLKAGARIDQRFQYSVSSALMTDSTALIWATRVNALRSMKVLLEACANPSLREKSLDGRGVAAPGHSARSVAETPEARALLKRYAQR